MPVPKSGRKSGWLFWSTSSLWVHPTQAGKVPAVNSGETALEFIDVLTDSSNFAQKSNVLELDNTDAFTPDADYEPATKKYVDDNAGGATVLVKTSDESVTSSTSLQNDDVISIAYTTGDTVSFTITVFVVGSSTGDIKLSFSPSGTRS